MNFAKPSLTKKMKTMQNKLIQSKKQMSVLIASKNGAVNGQTEFKNMKKEIKPLKIKKPVNWETPKFAKDIFSWILGEPEIKSPETKKVNLLK